MMLRKALLFLALIASPALALVPQPNWIAGVYTIAAGPDHLPSAPANAFYMAWVSDRPGSAGFMVSDGSAWTSDVGPAGATGSTGATGATGSAGAAGSAGATGAAGTNGNTILNGATVPSGSVGVNGDFYVDTIAVRLYGPKTAGVWGSGVSIVGPTGATGSAGATGATGTTGSQGPAGVNAFSSPTARTLSLATAYQATDTSKPAVVTVNLSSTATLSLSGGTTNTADILIGSTNGVAGGTGTIICKYANTNTGALTIGLNLSTVSAAPCSFSLPSGWYWAVRGTAGTVTIVSAFDQSVG